MEKLNSVGKGVASLNMCGFGKRLTLAKYYKDEDWSIKDADINLNKKPRSEPLKWRKCFASQTLKLNSRGLKSVPSTLKLNSDAGTLKKEIEHRPAKKKIKPGISEYELQVQKNIAEQKKCFDMLQLDVAKQELLELLPRQCKKQLESSESDASSLGSAKKQGRPPGTQVDKKVALKVEQQTVPARSSTRLKRTTQHFDYLDYLHVEEALATDRLHFAGLKANVEE